METIAHFPPKIVPLTFCGKKMHLGQRTFIMGILNVTPDSFYDGGQNTKIDKAIHRAKEMVQQGADFIDLGGESTRPGSKAIETEEELKRIIPVLSRLLKEVNVPVSVDTYKPEVAKEVLKAGAHMINDVYGLQRFSEMASIIAKYKAGVIIMHNQEASHYEGNVMDHVIKSLKTSINLAHKAGIAQESIIIDPGIGFGKNSFQNQEVFSQLGRLKQLSYPVLLGASRKSMIGNILELPVEERLEGSLATTVMGIVQGVDIVRVHDVAENLKAAKVTDTMVRCSPDIGSKEN